MMRSEEKELMDLAGNSPEILADDLRNLRRLNRYLCGSRSVLLALRRALGQQGCEAISLIDVGTGSADIPAAISAWTKRRHMAATIVGVDADPITAAIAAQRVARLAGVEIIQGDAGALPFAPASFDYVVASQFLHHFPEARIIALLKHWAKLARRAIVISDLRRHPVAYHGIRWLTQLTTRNIMTLTDAPLSVRRAFTIKEWRELLSQADIGAVEVFSVFPFRMAAVIRLGGGR